jgi:aminoglycoside 3-N-acetyltransferase
MLVVNQAQLTQLLQTLPLQPGDGLLVHSALQFFGKSDGGIGIYLEAINQAIDLNLDHSKISGTGTLAVPTFNFGFARGEAFDPAISPSQNMGVFSEFVRQHPAAKRTSHPMQSLAVLGQHANDLSWRDTLSAFDPGSAFERMLELDFKILLFGADIQAISMFHYSEQRAAVPYRYWKDFSGPVCKSAGWETRTYRMFVRDLNIDPQIELYPVQSVLDKRGQWHAVQLNYGKISLCRMVDFVSVVDEFLARDPWSLVINHKI